MSGGAEEVALVSPRGFCAGVERAILIVERVLKKHGAPVYVKHEIVHNKTVIEDFKKRGVVFIEDPRDVPPGLPVVYSAHGVSRAVRRAAAERGLTVYDATCPLVSRIHAGVSRLRRAGYEIVMIGHRGHPEVEGTLGQADGGIYLVENAEDIAALSVENPRKLAYVTQTTLSVDDTKRLVALLKERFPGIRLPEKDDICYATQNRQDAVKAAAGDCDVFFVVGSAMSSNSNRLKEVAGSLGARAYLVDCADDIDPRWLEGAKRIGLTAGASAPERIVKSISLRLREWTGAEVVETPPAASENVSFSAPKDLLSVL
ncbi:MAG: 4-hydroxy-3-methylbut-2-enyl diphosphate reductase [Candidatus Dadabacteria bacterium]|nr:4-hydroxy-3-methylbut-2-enyl diphosphate reductase [Candidatus Dadabacteria bacterium]